jgi:DNA-binding transcriptional LysR family regulator
MEREDWGSLAAFAVVAEERSFTRAAARLGVSPSALSHTLRGLEERLRIRLLARSTRSVSTTEAGERLLSRLRPALHDISQAVDDLGRLLERPTGHIRISASRSAARAALAPVLPRFARDYPDIVLEVLIEPRLTDIVARRLDAGIRLGESLEKDVVAVPVTGKLRMAVVGTPRYFAAHPAPTSPHDLRSHRCINYRLQAAGVIYKWEFERGSQKMEIAVDGPLVFDDDEMALDAALSVDAVRFPRKAKGGVRPNTGR